MDFHSQKDQDIIVWVTRSLEAEKWTSIREIGVQYDAALVVTTLRATPQSPANADTFTVWSVSLTNHGLTPLLKGVNLRWLDSMRFSDGGPLELTAVYDSCSECAADTYFTAFRFDVPQHSWAARWMRGGQGVPLSANPPDGVAWTPDLRCPGRTQRTPTAGHMEPLRLRQAEESRGLYLPLRPGHFQQPGAHPTA